MRQNNIQSKKALTLIELLIVIAIIGVLATTSILVLNPAELTKRSRDSDRISDMANLNKALGLVQVQGVTNFGETNKIYVSLPDDSAPYDCAEYNLPALPTGWAYVCKPSSEYRKTDGNGWLPINLNSISTGSPLPVLPVDPKQN